MSFKKILMGIQASFVKFKAEFILKDLIKLLCFSRTQKKQITLFFIKKVPFFMSKKLSNICLYVN